jgi:tetratricopeptide (TPR) repeat protein
VSRLVGSEMCIRDRNNKINDAIKVRKKMVQLFPDHVEYLFNLAESFVYASKFEDAIEVFDKIEKITGISEQVTQQKKLLFIQLNKLDKAIAEVQKLIDSNPSEPSYYEILAELYSANKMQDKALEVYQKIISIDPQNANIHLYLSHYYGQTGKAEMAYNEMKLAFENSNLELDYKIKEMLRYYTSMELNDTIKMQGIELLEIMQRAHPKEANALSVYADFLMKDNRIKEARDKYYKALELEKDRLPIWNQLLIIDSQLNDYSAMEKDSKQAIELFPNETNTYFFNGIANLQLGNSKQAIQVLKQGLDLIVENPQLSGPVSYTHLTLPTSP